MADNDFTGSSSNETRPAKKRSRRDHAFEVKNRVDGDLFQVMTALLVCEYAVGAMDAIKGLEMRAAYDSKCREVIAGGFQFPDDAEALGHIGNLISQSITTLHRLKEFVNEPV